ncbi:MAG: hypothetical protein ACPG8W_00310 [Candidatus Promineifilaceae bacterium]
MLIEAQTSVNYTFFEEDAERPSNNLTHLPIDLLEKHCLVESQRFQQTGQCKTEFGYELCRRALKLQNESAWTVLMRVYQQLVAHWVRNHPSFLSSREDEFFFVNRAFERLWRNIACKPQKFEKFTSLKGLLRFLKLCVHSAVLDDGPRRSPVDESSIESVESLLIGERGVRLDQRNKFWQIVQQQLNNEAERVAIGGYFLFGMKNREIAAAYPSLFEDAKQIANLRLTVIRRFARIPAFEAKLRDILGQEPTHQQHLTC